MMALARRSFTTWTVRVALSLAAVSTCVACAISDVQSGSASSRPSERAAGTPGANTFAPVLCHDALCWVAPEPQGNTLRAVATSPGGTSFAVGDHGTVLRWSGAGWIAIGLPPDKERYRNLRAVHVSADDEVWVAGEGGAVYRYDGSTFVAAGPDVLDADHIALWVGSRSDVWLASAQGAVWHYDGAAWTASLSAKTGTTPETIAGMWASASDDVWVAGTSEDGQARLWHFDGATWSDEALVTEEDDLLTPPGAVVAISGAVRGEPWIAFEHRVVARSSTGRFLTRYDVPRAYQREVSRNAALLVRAPTDVWLAHDGGSVQRFVGDDGWPKRPKDGQLGVPGMALGIGAGESTLVLRVSGRISDPLAVGTASRALETPTLRCTPYAAGALCVAGCSACEQRLVRIARDGAQDSLSFAVPRGAQLRGNGNGMVAAFTEGELVVKDVARGARKLSLPSDGSGGDLLRDVALTEDGRLFALNVSCDLFVFRPNTSSPTRVTYEDDTPRRHSCQLHQPADDTVFVSSAHYVDDDAPDDEILVVRSSDGAVVQRAPVPSLAAEWVAGVTASGRTFLGGRPPERGAGPRMWRLDGKTWHSLEVRWQEAAQKVTLAARGETVVAHLQTASEREGGATLHVFENDTARAMVVPVHDVAGLALTEGGVFGVRGALEVSDLLFEAEGAASVFFVRLDATSASSP